MERRLAVHAGGNPQALRRTWLVGLALAGLTSFADAKPGRRDARQAFDRGVAAYQNGDFEAAAAAFGTSFGIERDGDTLFAWAQSERKLDHCNKAIELYEELLGFSLPPANKTAVELTLSECRALVTGNARPAPAVPPAPAGAEPAVPPAPAGAAPPPSPRVAERVPAAPGPPWFIDVSPAARVWYSDPVALGLLGGGAVAAGVGAGLLISAGALDKDARSARSYGDARSFSDQARSRGNLGLITTGVGGALIVGGVAWIVLHRDGGEQRVVTGWRAPGGVGLAITGVF